MPVVTYISSARRPASLRMRYTNQPIIIIIIIIIAMTMFMVLPS